IQPDSGVSMLSANRPEVLYATGAGMTCGTRGTPLHPLGSLEDHAYVLRDAARVDPEAVSALAYTGGTTGEPKGVMNTYRGSAAMAQIMLTEWQWPDQVRHLVCTPLSHAGS